MCLSGRRNLGGTKVSGGNKKKVEDEMVPGQGGNLSARAREFSGAVPRPIQQLLFLQSCVRGLEIVQTSIQKGFKAPNGSSEFQVDDAHSKFLILVVCLVDSSLVCGSLISFETCTICFTVG